MRRLIVITRQIILTAICSGLIVACGGGGEAPAPTLVDLDSDGIWDINDSFPEDTDNDGLKNADDTDDDNDGIADAEDVFPLDPLEHADFDNDGVGDVSDRDDDGDGVLDEYDVFPFDPYEDTDTDVDGLGNNADLDNDADGFGDDRDLFPNDATQAGDHDGDGVDSLLDYDDDNDGYLDSVESSEGADPLDAASIPADADSDGLSDQQELALGSNVTNADTDQDGLEDAVEHALGTNPNAADSDSDGVLDGDEAGDDYTISADADGDGVIDALDFFATLHYDLSTSYDQKARFGVAVSADGEIFVATPGAVLRGTVDGELQEMPDEYAVMLSDVVASSTTHIYRADAETHRIQQVQLSDGAIVQTHEHQPDGTPGGFLAPQGIALDSAGRILVADTWNNRIQRYDPLTDEWQSWGSMGQAAGEYRNPMDIAASADGDIAVADADNYRVQIFNDALEWQYSLTADALGESAFNFQPLSLAFGADAKLYVLDAQTPRIVVLTAAGNLDRVIKLNGLMENSSDYRSIAVDTDDRVYVSAPGSVVVF